MREDRWKVVIGCICGLILGMLVAAALIETKPPAQAEKPISGQLHVQLESEKQAEEERILKTVFDKIRSEGKAIPTQAQWSRLEGAVEDTAARHDAILRQDAKAYADMAQRLDAMQNTINVIVNCINIQCVHASIETHNSITINPAPQILPERLAQPAGGGVRSR